MVRTGLTGRRSRGGPPYGMAGAVCDVAGRGSTGRLSNLTAAPPERGDSIPNVDASRLHQPDELLACLFAPACATAKARRMSIAAVMQKKAAIRARKLKKAAWREFFVFMAMGVRTRATNRLPAGYVSRRRLPSFGATNRVYLFANNPSKLFFRRKSSPQAVAPARPVHAIGRDPQEMCWVGLDPTTNALKRRGFAWRWLECEERRN